MNSRITVSILFILIVASLFTSDATTAFKRLRTSHRSCIADAPVGRAVLVLNRFIAGGYALMSEFQDQKDMITMIHLDGDRLLVTRYRGTGNRPRLVGSISPDGKTITLNFIDATNLLSSPVGHMQRLVLNLIDSGHHTESADVTMADGKRQMYELLDRDLDK
jgi:hypothetical protein